VRSFTHPGDVHVAALLGRRLPLSCSDKIKRSSPIANRYPSLAARQAILPVRRSARRHRRHLRTKSLRRDFKRRAHVIVQPAHQPPILAVYHSAHFKLVLYGSVVRRAVFAEGDRRCAAAWR